MGLLDGLRVVEGSAFVAAPLGGLTLAQLGADVIRFDTIGGFLIRDREYPHIMVSVIVVDSPYYATLDEKGGFSIPSVPDGKVNLKVWTRGRWATEQEVDAGSKEELTVRVASPQEKEAAAAE